LPATALGLGCGVGAILMTERPKRSPETQTSLLRAIVEIATGQRKDLARKAG